jgi:murein DD-endopeptidase MepM/ murein hydrolase activator NlpD
MSLHSDRTGFSDKKRTPRQRMKDRLDAIAARRAKGKVIAPVTTGPEKFDPFPVTFGYREPGPYAYGYHTGEDHACPIGSQCQATSYGHVVGIDIWGESYGKHLVIRTADGKYDYGYCHMSHIRLSIGDHVTPGEPVGQSGDTGNTTGPHVHFEARTAGGHYGDDVNPINVKAHR